MKVRYTLPVHGTLRRESSEPIILGDYSFQFKVATDTGHVNEIVVEISNISQEHWPTLIPVEQDPSATIPRFPFDRNPESFVFSKIADNIRNLESYLSVFGLERIDFDRLHEEWIADEKDEKVGMFAGFEHKGYISDPIAKPVSDGLLARSITASATTANNTLFLSYFRVAQINYINRIHIETIKYSYLCLECLFANGKFKKNVVILEFSKSSELTKVVKDTVLTSKLPHFERLRRAHPYLKEPKDFLHFIVNLRGRLQHATNHPDLGWHPSKQYTFETEALCIFSVAEEICYLRTMHALRTVPMAPSSSDASQPGLHP